MDDREIDEVALEGIVREIAHAVGSIASCAEIHARVKTRQSALDKLARRGSKPVWDFIGVRLIVRDEAECYSVVKRLHAKFPVLGGECDDYIWMPKSNGYRSLHITILTSGGRCVEVQVRTREMHAFAQTGEAAHRLYKPAAARMATAAVAVIERPLFGGALAGPVQFERHNDVVALD